MNTKSSIKSDIKKAKRLAKQTNKKIRKIVDKEFVDGLGLVLMTKRPDDERINLQASGSKAMLYTMLCKFIETLRGECLTKEDVQGAVEQVEKMIIKYDLRDYKEPKKDKVADKVAEALRPRDIKSGVKDESK